MGRASVNAHASASASGGQAHGPAGQHDDAMRMQQSNRRPCSCQEGEKVRKSVAAVGAVAVAAGGEL